MHTVYDKTRHVGFFCENQVGYKFEKYYHRTNLPPSLRLIMRFLCTCATSMRDYSLKAFLRTHRVHPYSIQILSLVPRLFPSTLFYTRHYFIYAKCMSEVKGSGRGAWTALIMCRHWWRTECVISVRTWSKPPRPGWLSSSDVQTYISRVYRTKWRGRAWGGG